MDFKSLFVPFRYAPLHKERFKNSKLYLGLKIKCKFETGLRSEKCKLNSGRVTLRASFASRHSCFACHLSFGRHSLRVISATHVIRLSFVLRASFASRHLSFGRHSLRVISATHVIRLSFALRASFASRHLSRDYTIE